MAGDWIPHEKGLSKKAEVLAIAKATGKHRRWVTGALMEFWEWVDSESVDGKVNICLGDLPYIVDETDAVFWNAVVSVGWLRVEARGLYVPMAVDSRVVYFVLGGPFIKIGFTSMVSARVSELQISSPHRLSILGTMSGGPSTERRLHRRFANIRHHGEWFLDCEELGDLVRANAQEAL